MSFRNANVVQNVVKFKNGRCEIVAGNEQKRKTEAAVDQLNKFAEQIIMTTPFVQFL